MSLVAGFGRLTSLLQARIDALERKSGKKAQPLRKRVMVDDDIDVKPVIKRERLG